MPHTENTELAAVHNGITELHKNLAVVLQQSYLEANQQNIGRKRKGTLFPSTIN
jgi:hypothetical protein